jgi:hypothetical protein
LAGVIEAGGKAWAAAMAAGNHSIPNGELDGGGSDLLVEGQECVAQLLAGGIKERWSGAHGFCAVGLSSFGEEQSNLRRRGHFDPNILINTSKRVSNGIFLKYKNCNSK